MKTCPQCGQSFGRRVSPSGYREAASRFAVRQFCGQACATFVATGAALGDAEGRFMAKTWRDLAGCWVWIGANNGKYGCFTEVRGRDKRNRLAHRWSYEHFVGPIPEGLQIDHLCRLTLCVNPLHLEPVTTQENSMRRPEAMRTRAGIPQRRRTKETTR